jgi:hypothetical protein
VSRPGDHFEGFRACLAERPELSFSIDESELAVEPPAAQGFALVVTREASGWVVWYDGWHEHFDDEDQAVRCFQAGLSGRCRVKVELRGETPYRWTAERLSEQGWRPISTVGIFWYPFWRRRRLEYRQNPPTPPRGAECAASR